MPQTTAGDLIYAALRKASITLGPGRTPSPAQMTDAIAELRRLTGSLNCDRLFIYSVDTLTFPILTSKKTYTIGKDPAGLITADFDVPRPQLMTMANYISMGNPAAPIRYPLSVLTPQEWASITIQELMNAIPEAIYNDYAYPLSTLYLYGQPVAGNKLEIWVWHQVPVFTSATDIVVLPLQYEDALVLNLACRLAPQFQRAVDPDVRLQARDSLMRLESINAPQPIADTSALCWGSLRYNIFSDQTKR
jgi:hypothetical protein